ncbi:MAG: HAD family hydrolase [Chloroflexota bacterium]|nr:HAD family hydrolase [Chloroflexota bacterium]
MEPAIHPPLLRAAAGKRLVVFDYDGTLAELEVDWEEMRRDLREQALQSGFDSHFRPLWREMARLRDERGIEAVRALFPAVRRYEQRGVERQLPRPEIVEFARRTQRASDADGPTLAVFSANLHATVLEGLSALGLEPFAVVVGADDVDRWKPEAAGLQLAMQRAGAGPSETLFLGDSPGDQDAAQAAGAHFLSV